MSPDSRTVLVTGGAGFIGSHLVDRLLSEGLAVTVVDDLSTGRQSNLEAASVRPGFRFHEVKVSEWTDLAAEVARSRAVVHFAAAVGVELVMKSPIRTIETNLGETESILAAAAPVGVPVLLASTSEVYGKSNKTEFTETDDLLIGPPTLGRWSYACSKLMDEFLALAYMRERGLPVTIARFFNTVGPRQTGAHGMVIPRFLEAARIGAPLRVYGDGQQTRCFCHVLDTVEAVYRLLWAPQAAGRVVNVGNDVSVTIRELAERVVARTGSASSIESVPYTEAFGPGFEDMLHRRPSLAALEGLTGFRPRRSLDEILDDLIGDR
jgi:UDP-glucose 4-epimerase